MNRIQVKPKMSRTKTALPILVGSIILIFVSVLVFSSITANFLFSRDLTVGNFIENDSGGGHYGYTVNMTDGNTFVRSIGLIIQSDSSGQYQLTVEIPYQLNIQVDSVKLMFSSAPSVITLYVLPLNGGYPIAHFYTNDNLGVVYEMSNLGRYGSSTVTFEFMLTAYQVSHLTMTADISMHQTSTLQLTSLKAHAFLDAELSSNNS